ncbi:MAG: sterol desaturase family protein [Bacteroidia bacterium]
MKAAEETPVLFTNPVMKLLAKTNRQITVTYILLYTILLFYFHFKVNAGMGAGVTLIWFFGGVLSWSFFEYILHRYIFHISGESAAIKRFAYVMHGIHHDHPRVENYVFMPPAPGTIYISIFLGLFWLILGDLSFVFLAGFIIGYLIYANIHFYIHLKRPVKRFGFFWRHHSLHHYKYPDKAFGVSSPLWDIVFGTMPPAKKASES